jgi:predicted Zn-dependent peptidase
MSKQFQKTKFPSGLRVLTERHENVPSATIGVWIEAGAVFESEAERGLSHLLEHMVFKGTARRSLQQIAATMDSIGGQLNAFTERELVCFHARVLAERAPLALELLCDFITCPTLDARDLEIEKGVILEEIKSVEDSPEEWVEDLFQQTIWPSSPWGFPILGAPENVEKFSSRDVRDYMSRHYSPQNIVVAAVGDIQHDEIVQQAGDLLQSLPGSNLYGLKKHSIPRAPRVTSHNTFQERDTEQIHLICGTKCYDYRDPKRYAGWLLDAILCGGYSSRLFQEIREKRGLCYNIGAISTSYRKTGFWAIETSVAPETAPKVLDLIGRELRKIKTRGVTKAELERAKQMLRAGLLLSEESSSAQMNRIARNELYYGRQRETEEVLADVLRVSQADVLEAANEMFAPETMNLTALGPQVGSTLEVEVA